MIFADKRLVWASLGTVKFREVSLAAQLLAPARLLRLCVMTLGNEFTD